eukprot:SAG22_NODE_6825_length_807_cov_0.889831_1_plen_34_part_10
MLRREKAELARAEGGEAAAAAAAEQAAAGGPLAE